MAPNFLSKFQRASSNANSRDRSVESSRDPSPRRSRVPSLATEVKKSSQNPSGANTPDQDNLSVHTNPSVTIGVIPPSPRATIHSDISFPSDSHSEDPPASAPPPARETLQERRNEGSQRKETLSFSVSSPSIPADFSESALPTPTPARRFNTAQGEKKSALLTLSLDSDPYSIIIHGQPPSIRPTSRSQFSGLYASWRFC